MVELYNDQLIDLYESSHKNSAKLDIKKDKKGKCKTLFRA